MSQGRRRSPLPADWDKRRRKVMRRDQRTCQLAGPRCTIAATEVDHIAGHDDHALGNLQAVCSTCHATKTGKEARARQPNRQRPAERHPGLSHP